MRDPKLRWYEPQHALLGDQKYFTHAWGSVYVLSDHAASTLARVSEAVPDGLRFFNNEGKLLCTSAFTASMAKVMGQCILFMHDVHQATGFCHDIAS